MGKTIDYPKASFKASQEMADAVAALGGSCSVEMCAEKMGNKVSGAFHNIISSAQKFRLINYKMAQLSTSSLYREIKLSYTDQEKTNLLISAFLSPPVFHRLYERFKGRELPVSMLDKMLIKEYEVDDAVASRIKRYFIDGAKLTGLLNSQNQLIIVENSELDDKLTDSEEKSSNVLETSTSFENESSSKFIDSDEFVFHVIGPGINTTVAIREEEDFLILEAVIRKVKKRFNSENQIS